MAPPIKSYPTVLTNSSGESIYIAVQGTPPSNALKILLGNEDGQLNNAFAQKIDPTGENFDKKRTSKFSGMGKFLGGVARASGPSYAENFNPQDTYSEELYDKAIGFTPLFKYDNTTNKFVMLGNLDDPRIYKDIAKSQKIEVKDLITFNSVEDTEKDLNSKKLANDLYSNPPSKYLDSWRTNIGMTASQKASLYAKQTPTFEATDFDLDVGGMKGDLGTQIEKIKKFGFDDEWKAQQKEYLIDYFSGLNNVLDGPLNFAKFDLDVQYNNEGQLAAIGIMNVDTGRQVQALDADELAIVQEAVRQQVRESEGLALKGYSKENAIELGLDSDDWTKAGSIVFDENGDQVGTTFEAADGTIRYLPDDDVAESVRAAINRQKYGQSTLGGTTTRMGAAGISPSLTTADPYRTIPTGQYAQALQTQLPGAELPAIQSLYQQNLPAFQRAYNLAQLLGMVAVDPDATKGQTGTIGFQKFLQTNPDIKSIYSQGLNAIENVKDQVRAGRLPGTLSAEDQMIYDTYIAGSSDNPMQGHLNELELRQYLTQYLPEATRYSARMALQRRYDAALTGDPNALATSNIYGTSGNPWAGGTTTAMPVFGGGLSFGGGTPMGTTTSQPSLAPVANVGPTYNNQDIAYTKDAAGNTVASIIKAEPPEGATFVRANPQTGWMEKVDSRTGQVIDKWWITSDPDPHWSGGVQASNINKWKIDPQTNKPFIQSGSGAQVAQFPLDADVAKAQKKLMKDEEKIKKKAMQEARQFEMLY